MPRQPMKLYTVLRNWFIPRGNSIKRFRQFVDLWEEDGEVIVSGIDCHKERRLSDSDLSM